MQIPVVIVHRGNQNYLHYAVRCAKRAKNKVVLIGDETNRNLCEWYDYRECQSKEYDEFAKLYRHMSSNPEKFELICFERYYLTYEYAKKAGVSKLVMMDSDICLYNRVDENTFSDVKFAVSEPIQKHEWQWIASAHFSYWTIEALEEFMRFLKEMYTNTSKLEEKWNWHKSSGTPGGICDMTLLYLFCKNTNLSHVNTLSLGPKVFDNSLGNLSINGREYESDRRHAMKAVARFKGDLCFIEKRGSINLLVPAFYIHAQGDKKRFMRSLYNMNTSSVSMCFDDIGYFLKRVYEKILRTLGIEKHYNW